jgi:Family of unknown function (DUF6492)
MRTVTRIAVMTKSFAPDFELCVALNRSVLDNSPDTVQHHIIVPRSDLKLFGRLAGKRTHIRCEADLLPRTFVRVPFTNIMVNLGRPFPPVRGWIQQQVVKLAAVAASEDELVLVVDSDVEFVRPFTEIFVKDGKVRFFRKPDQIDKQLPRHMTWHKVARALLGLPPAEPPYPDYIASPIAWEPTIVRKMLARVTATTGRPWPTAIAGQLDFSDCVLYGVFVDGVSGAADNSFASDDSLSLIYWKPVPLNLDNADHFLQGLRPTDVAACIQSKSRTPLPVREAAFAGLRARIRQAGAATGPAPDHVSRV